MSYDVIANGWRKLLKNGGAGYTEPAKTIGSIELNGTQESMGTFFEGSILVSKFQALKEGKTYVVKTDSGTFERVCSTYIEAGRTISFIGNSAMFGDEDNGDSFFVCTTPSLNEPEFIDLIAVDFNFGSHITVSEAETVHTIDPKYLPEEAVPKIINLEDYEGLETLAGNETQSKLLFTVLILMEDSFASGSWETAGFTFNQGRNLFDELPTDKPIMVLVNFIVSKSLAYGSIAYGDEGVNLLHVRSDLLYEDYPVALEVAILRNGSDGATVCVKSKLLTA